MKVIFSATCQMRCWTISAANHTSEPKWWAADSETLNQGNQYQGRMYQAQKSKIWNREFGPRSCIVWRDLQRAELAAGQPSPASCCRSNLYRRRRRHRRVQGWHGEPSTPCRQLSLWNSTSPPASAAHSQEQPQSISQILSPSSHPCHSSRRSSVRVFELTTSINSPYFPRTFSYTNCSIICHFNKLNCFDVLHFDTDAAEQSRNWTAVFSYNLLPYNFLWNSGMEVRRM